MTLENKSYSFSDYKGDKTYSIEHLPAHSPS